MPAEPLAEEYYPLPPRSVVGWIYTKEGLGREVVHNKDVCYRVIFCFFTCRIKKRMGTGFLI